MQVSGMFNTLEILDTDLEHTGNSQDHMVTAYSLILGEEQFQAYHWGYQCAVSSILAVSRWQSIEL